MPTGAVLAGGRSTRFGGADKAVAELAGMPMIRRVADRLVGADDPVGPGADRASGGDPVVDSLAVNCRPDQREAIEAAMVGYPLEVTYAEDEIPDLGPMAGIRNACRAVDDEYVFVVACDMPFVDPDFAASLFEFAAGREAAVPRLEDEWFQTTQSVYLSDAMADACDRALERGDRKIVEPLFALDHVVVDHEDILAITDADTFENCNTPEEFEAAAERIRTKRE